MNEEKNIKPTDWDLIAKLAFDQDTEPEALSPDEQQNLAEARELSRKVDLHLKQKKYDESTAWQQVHGRMQAQKNVKSFVWGKTLKIAASVALMVMLGAVAFYMLHTGKNVSSMEFASNDQIVSAFELPDGTKVSLNSHTKLTYPKHFQGNTREVSIQGEAFFEVKPDKTKPFIIHVGDAAIKVLGTSFNVNAYPGASAVEVIVATGKVMFSQKSATAKTNELILDPGEKGTLLCDGDTLKKSTNEDANYMAWKTRNLVFRQTPLKEVIAQLEKVYKIKIEVADEKINDLLLTAQFNDYSIEFIMEVISSTLELEIELKNDGQYTFKRK